MKHTHTHTCDHTHTHTLTCDHTNLVAHTVLFDLLICVPGLPFSTRSALLLLALPDPGPVLSSLSSPSLPSPTSSSLRTGERWGVESASLNSSFSPTGEGVCACACPCARAGAEGQEGRTAGAGCAATLTLALPFLPQPPPPPPPDSRPVFTPPPPPPLPLLRDPEVERCGCVCCLEERCPPMENGEKGLVARSVSLDAGTGRVKWTARSCV